MESDGTMNAAIAGEMNVSNTIIAGVRNDKYKVDGTVMNAAALEAWFLTAAKENLMLAATADAKIADAFNYAALNFLPSGGSPVFNASYWASTVVITNPSIDNPFFDQVSYIGAFDINNSWTEGWTEWDPINKNYPATTVNKGNGQFAFSTGIHITTDETWSGVIKLDGWVYVDAGATLTINAGTIIRATEKSVLVIQRGAKINAVGTSSSPIVFTSNQAAKLRSNSDWGGLVICGYGVNNLPGGEGIAEGGIDASYGGNDNSDNSGKLQFVRIEFPGFEVSTGSEVNGLTLCSVGNGTTIDHVQVSYSGDDGFEWFGGAVNAKYIISYKTEDDDFDTDNGFVGMVQYGLISRDGDIVDSDTANAFESDNDAAGSSNTPYTNAIFSNVSAFGPIASAETPVLTKNHEEGAAMRIRRSSKLQIFNALFSGWGRGVRMESDGTMNAAIAGEMNVSNTIIAGVRNDKYKVDGTVMDAPALEAWFLTTAKENLMLAATADAKITDAFNYDALNFLPKSGSPVLDASYWAVVSVSELKNSLKLKSYPNPFNGKTNIAINLENDSNVAISVFNSMGAKVSQLQNGRVTAGTHEFLFDATAMPKGIYIGVITIGQATSTVKMVAR
jgi:hypothetical protein